MSSERKKEKRENIKREKERKNFLGKNGFFCLFSGFSGEISFFFLSTIFFCFLSSRRNPFQFSSSDFRLKLFSLSSIKTEKSS